MSGERQNETNEMAISKNFADCDESQQRTFITRFGALLYRLDHPGSPSIPAFPFQDPTMSVRDAMILVTDAASDLIKKREREIFTQPETQPLALLAISMFSQSSISQSDLADNWSMYSFIVDAEEKGILSKYYHVKPNRENYEPYLCATPAFCDLIIGQKRTFTEHIYNVASYLMTADKDLKIPTKLIWDNLDFIAEHNTTGAFDVFLSRISADREFLALLPNNEYNFWRFLVRVGNSHITMTACILKQQLTGEIDDEGLLTEKGLSVFSDNLKRLYATSQLSKRFAERTKKYLTGSIMFAGLTDILTDEQLKKLNPDHRTFWTLWLNESSTEARFSLLVDLHRIVPETQLLDRLSEIALLSDPELRLYLTDILLADPKRYEAAYRARGVLDVSKATIDSVVTTLSKGELGLWGTAELIYKRLITDMANTDLRITTILMTIAFIRHHALTDEAGVEAHEHIEQYFSVVWKKAATPDERRALADLRRVQMFATDQNLLTEMKNIAEDVEEEAPRLLYFVHQAVHNYARSQTPDYLRLVDDYIADPSTETRRALKNHARLYPWEASPPEKFFALESLKKLQTPFVQKHMKRLIETADRYYTVQPERLAKYSQAKHLSERLKQFQETGDMQHAIAFMEAVPTLRLTIQRDLEKKANQDVTASLVSLDMIASELFTKTGSRWIEKLVLTAKGEARFTKSLQVQVTSVIRATQAMAVIDGEAISFPSTQAMLHILSETRNDADWKKAFTLLPVAMADDMLVTEERWQRYLSKAKEEMTSIVTGMGKSRTEAADIITGTDLVDLRKRSYSFQLEAILTTLRELYPEDTEAVEQRVASLTAALATQRLSHETFAKSPWGHAHRMAQFAIAGYRNATSGTLNAIHRMVNGARIDVIPFRYGAADGALVYEDGVEAPDPVAAIEKHFQTVPVMKHALREGD